MRLLNIILLILMNVVLIAILFGLQAESTSVLEKNEKSGTDANKTAIPHGANIDRKSVVYHGYITVVGGLPGGESDFSIRIWHRCRRQTASRSSF